MKQSVTSRFWNFCSRFSAEYMQVNDTWTD
jgi:hypothetical protein